MRTLAHELFRLMVCGLVLGGPALVWAQADVDSEIEAALGGAEKTPPPPAADKAAPAPAPAGEEGAAKPAPLPQIGDQDTLAIFKLQRGLYFSGDLGMFMTFAGVRGYSNLQPYVSLKAGYDINDYFGIQASLSSGYSSGNALSENDAPGAGGQEVVNFGLFNMGAEIVAAIRPTERFAIEPKLGGGMTRINPQPTDPNNVDGIVPAFSPHVSGGLDFKYLTLLTDFTAGASFTGYYVIGPNIPGLAIAFVTRYTF